MATATTTKTTEREASGLYFTETELTLALPGSSREEIDAGKSCGKRVFSSGSDRSDGTTRPDSGDGKSPAAKAQVVGWPPVRSFRKNTMRGEARYVKVAVDGAPYLRKVDLKTYGSYQELLGALESMFTCITIRNYQSENKLVDGANGMEYVLTYEDKDGDWMLAGDVPWKMFVECCKRIRLMKSAEVLDLGPRTPQIKEQ